METSSMPFWLCSVLRLELVLECEFHNAAANDSTGLSVQAKDEDAHALEGGVKLNGLNYWPT